MNNDILVILLLLISILTIIIYYGYLEKKKSLQIKKKEKYEKFNMINNNNEYKRKDNLRIKKDDGTACKKTGCDSLDPVSDPKYNMHQIVKQSILLEEHLANKNKRCRDCITKHFSHIIGLAEEAVMLACSDVNKYPLMSELPPYYDKLFKKWLKDTSCSLLVCKDLRNMRKKIIAIYFFNDEYKLDKTDDIRV
jgi:hypothetical protein|tara:strand:- start:7166 stop:7747 length:582 start_codon:yes stop_codon:yes gene_type:complete